MRIFLFLLLLPALLAAQTRQELRSAKQEVRDQLRSGFDVVLDPIQRVFTLATQPEQVANWAWTYTKSAEVQDLIRRKAARTVRVYVFDTAGQLDHPDLARARQQGATFTGEASGADGHGHGTHVAGTIAALGQYNLSTARALADAGFLEVVPVKVLNNAGSGLYSWMVNAGNWALSDMDKAEHRGKAIAWNYSLGGGGGDAAFSNLLARAAERGVAIFAASGNSYNRGVNYPGRDPSAKAIGALGQQGAGVEKAPFSTTGPEVWTAAPGVMIYSTMPGGAYGAMSGTSMATPNTVALYCVLAACNPKCSAADIIRGMERFAIDLAPAGRDEATGHGALQLDRILQADLCDGGTPDPKPDPKPEPEPKPEPPKPNPEPVKPQRWVSVAMPDIFVVNWRPQDGTTFTKTPIQMQVSYQTTRPADKAAASLQELCRIHFANRGYILLPGADVQDAAYWAAYFLELIFKQAGHVVNVERVSVYGSPEIYLNDPIPGGRNAATWKASVRAGVFTVNFETGKPEGK